MSEKLRIFEMIAEEWNSSDIEYVVAHGIEGFPNHIGRDLDILIREDHISEAFKIANHILTSKGYITILPPALWGDRLIGIKQDEPWESIEVHTITKLTWRSVNFVNIPDPQGRNGPFKIDPWISFVKRILLPFLATGVEKFKTKPNEFCFNEGEKEIVLSKLPSICGMKYAVIIVEAIENNDLEKIQILSSAIRNKLLWYNLYKRPFISSYTFIMTLFKRISQFFHSCGPIIAIVGTDGVGKSTVINILKEKLQDSIFTDVVIRHWRPGLIPPLNNLLRLKGKHINTTEKFLPRREPGRFHWLRLLYYSFDFFVGYWLKERIESAKQKVVLYDRCALDMSVDPVRYGLSSKQGTYLLWKLIPKPDLLVFLYDEPEKIFARKSELPKNEIARQQNEWFDMANKGEIDAILNVNETPDKNSDALVSLIYESFIEKNQRLAVEKANNLNWTNSILIGIKSDKYNQTNRHNIEKKYSFLEFRDGRMYLIPIVNPKTTAESLAVYNPQKFKAKFAKSFLKVAIRVGFGNILLKRRTFIIDENNFPRGPYETNLIDHLKILLKDDNLHFSFSLGTPGPHRKPVILALNSAGNHVAYIKVGWNRQTNVLVENEYNALRTLNDFEFKHSQFPRIINFSKWDEKTILITQPLDFTNNIGNELNEKHLNSLIELASFRIEYETLRASSFWKDLNSRYNEVKSHLPDYQKNIIESSLELLDTKIGKLKAPFFMALGDFTPWNLGYDKNSKKLMIIDLEYFREKYIAGWDIFHFLTQSIQGIENQLKAIYSKHHSQILEYFKLVEIPNNSIGTLYLMYLVDIFLLWNTSWINSDIQMLRNETQVFRQKSLMIATLSQRIRSNNEYQTVDGRKNHYLLSENN